MIAAITVVSLLANNLVLGLQHNDAIDLTKIGADLVAHQASVTQTKARLKARGLELLSISKQRYVVHAPARRRLPFGFGGHWLMYVEFDEAGRCRRTNLDYQENHFL